MIYFNLDGTLTANNVDFEHVYHTAIDTCELDALNDSYGTYTDTFFNYFQNGWAFPRRQAILDLLTEQNIDDTGVSDKFATAWEDAEADATELVEDAASVLEQLDDTYPLGVLTNGTGRLQRMKLENTGTKQFFDRIVISSEIGIVKPHSGIFDAAKESADADDYVIVSHDLRRDILPAKRAEFKTIWLSATDAEDNPQVQKLVDKQVSSLSEVPAAVDELCS